MEKPVPMPHRMRSNLTFQPKAVKLEPQLALDQGSVVGGKVHDDNVSQLAIDYTLH